MGRKKKYFTEEERKAAKRERDKKWREANPEKVKESFRKFKERNPDKVKEINRKSARKRYQENPDKFKENSKKWREENPEKEKERQRKYKSTPIGRGNCLVNSYRQSDKKTNRGECTITAQWIVDNIFSGQRCFYCDESDWHKLGCDRINNDLPHTPDNVVCCCEECNKKRGKKSFEEFCEEMRNKA